MGRKPFCLILALLLTGCALTRPPLACRGALQPINVQTAEKSRGPV
jgi:hypothetical protein